MDGLDWMTVARSCRSPLRWPRSGPGLSAAGRCDRGVGVCGATIGFAFFNRPVAKLFLAMSAAANRLLVGWLLLALATGGHWRRRRGASSSSDSPRR